jgi:hypothetical protein
VNAVFMAMVSDKLQRMGITPREDCRTRRIDAKLE